MGASRPRADSTPNLPVREIWRRFWPYARPQWPLLAWTLVFVLVGPVLESAAIWLFKVVVDEVMTPRDLRAFAWIAPLYLGIAIVGSVASGMDTLLASRVAERFVLSMRTSVFAHLQTLSLDVFERRRLGDTLARLSGDINSIESLMLSGAADAVSYGLRIVLFGGLLFYLRWDLALVALLVAPLFWWTSRYFSRRIKTASRAQRSAAGALISCAEETLANAQLIQAYNGEADAVARFQAEGERGYQSAMDAAKVRSLFSPIVDALEVIGAILVIGLGTWELSRGRITLGGLLAFLTLLRGLYGPIRGLSKLMNTAAAASAGAERLIELLDEQPLVESGPRTQPVGRLSGRLELRDVSFCYPEREAASLEAFPFRSIRVASLLSSVRVAPGRQPSRSSSCASTSRLQGRSW